MLAEPNNSAVAQPMIVITVEPVRESMTIRHFPLSFSIKAEEPSAEFDNTQVDGVPMEVLAPAHFSLNTFDHWK
jgi:hypothetical protein